MKKSLTLAVIVVTIISAAPFITHAVASFFVDSSGNIGIGNSDPQAPLDVSGSIYSRLVSATSSTVDWDKGNVQMMGLSGTTTLSFVNANAGSIYKLILNQDLTGNRQVVWPSTVKWVGGMAPVLSSTPASTDVMSFIFDGSRYLGSSVLGYAGPSLLSSLVSYWKFDGDNSTDIISSNNGTDTNISYSSGNGKINDGAGFNGSSSKIVIGNPANLRFTNQFSISFWMKVANVSPSGTYGIVTKLGSSGNYSYGIWYGGGGWDTFISSNGADPDSYGWSTSNSSSPANPPDTNWHHFVFTYDTNAGSPIIKVYRDGTDVTTASDAATFNHSWSGSTINDSTANVVIGNADTFSWPMGGSLDEVGMWSRVLSPTEVSDLYNSGSGKQYPF